MNDAQKLFWDNRPPAAMQALHDVMAERHRQMMVEGWTAKHDDEHSNGAMAVAGACYALSVLPDRVSSESVAKLWPWTGWAWKWWKPKDKRRNLVRAAALLLAEIERMDRAEATRWKPCARCITPDYCTNNLRGCDIAESREAGIEPIAGVTAAPAALPYKPPQNYCEQCKQIVNWNPCITDGEAINCVLAQQARTDGVPLGADGYCPDCEDVRHCGTIRKCLHGKPGTPGVAGNGHHTNCHEPLMKDDPT